MPQFPDGLTTEHLFDAQFDLETPQALCATPLGGRNIFIIKSGTVSGPKLNGTVMPGGGDWYLGRADGVGELDVRGTIKADDGALIFVRYTGVLNVAPAVLGRAFTGEDVPLSEYYFRTTPRLETSAEQYAWLNSRVCVAVGAIAPNRVSYRVFGIL